MKRVDDEGLNELFDIVVEETSTDNVIEIVPVEEPEETDDNMFIDKEIKKLLNTSNRLMSTAQSLLEAAPDPDTVTAASSMISSIGHLLTEFNKSVLMDKRHQNVWQLEKMKIEARRELAEYKASVRLGEGGGGDTYVQNNMIAMSQEDLVDMLKEQSKNILADNEARIAIDVDNE